MSTKMNLPEDEIRVTLFSVVTIANNNVVHSYGPYSFNEAVRMKNQFDKRHGSKILVYVRKLLNHNEVTARPNSPKG